MKNNNGDTFLHIAASDPKKLSMLKKIIADGSDDINAQNNDGNTPLHIAFLNRNQSALVELLAANPNTQIKNNEGKIPSNLFKE